MDQIIKENQKILLTEKTDFLILCLPLEGSHLGIFNLVFFFFHLETEYFWQVS